METFLFFYWLTFKFHMVVSLNLPAWKVKSKDRVSICKTFAQFRGVGECPPPPLYPPLICHEKNDIKKIEISAHLIGGLMFNFSSILYIYGYITSTSCRLNPLLQCTLIIIMIRAVHPYKGDICINVKK